MNETGYGHFGIAPDESTRSGAVIVVGRRIDRDALGKAQVRPNSLPGIAKSVAAFRSSNNQALSVVHTGINWVLDDEDEEYFWGDVGENAIIVGAVLAVAHYPGSPTKLSKNSIKIPEIPADVWSALLENFGLEFERPDTLFLSSTNWSFAGIYGADVKFDADGEFASSDGSQAQLLAITCSVDEPAGVALDLDQLPDEFQLRAYYL